MNKLIQDKHFKVQTLGAMQNPYSLIWTPAHGDYTEGFIGEEWDEGTWPNEQKAWELIEKKLLHKHRVHAGPLEHVSIVMAVKGFPHDVPMQHRTHRIASFDVQSQRYTGDRVVKIVKGELDIEEVFYFRPLGIYKDRTGNNFEYYEGDRKVDIEITWDSVQNYKLNVDSGMPPEMARHYLTQNIRQNYVFSCNVRSLLHFFNMRVAKDAQLEIQTLCEHVYDEFHKWVPELAEYYRMNHWAKSPLTF